MVFFDWRSKIRILMRQKWDFTCHRIKMIGEPVFYLYMEAVGWFAASVRLARLSSCYILPLLAVFGKVFKIDGRVQNHSHVRIVFEVLSAYVLFLLLPDRILKWRLSIECHLYFLVSDLVCLSVFSLCFIFHTETHDHIVSKIARRLNVMVVSVE